MVSSRASLINSLALVVGILSSLALAGSLNEAAAARTDQPYQLVIFKAKRALLLLRGRRVVDRWRIHLGEHPVGRKVAEGDGRTPEGRYFIDARILDTRFHHSLHLSYPNEADIERARLAHQAPGSNIAIHGLPDDYHPTPRQRIGDWTDGCIALNDRAMDILWRLVDVGTPVTILP